MNIFTDECEASSEFFRAETGVDENTSFAGNDQNSIPS
jgi:hypothetical protein